MEKKKIISISPYVPVYSDVMQGPSPSFAWNSPNGDLLGVWSFDLLDLLPSEILKATDEFTFEVWHPDLRADKIYSHTFQNGLTCKLFPAIEERKMYGVNIFKEVHSPCLCEELKKESVSGNIIVHLQLNLLGFNKIILKEVNAPIVLSIRGKISLPPNDFLIPTRNIFSKINILCDHLFIKRYINKIK